MGQWLLNFLFEYGWLFGVAGVVLLAVGGLVV
jgi:hypothetical protein